MIVALVCYCGKQKEHKSEFIRSLIYESDVIVAVDSGLDFLNDIDIMADYAIGDFDSLQDQSLLESKVKSQVIWLPEKKDETDLRVAIDFVINKIVDVAHISIFTHFSGRVDQQIGVISQLVYLFKKNVSATIYSDQHIIKLLANGRNYLNPHENHQYYSFIALSDQVFFNSSQGLEYSLNNLTLEYFSEIGISNYAVEKIVEVDIDSGLLLSIETFRS
jgi:thiamine pyrophosphokinase